MNIVLMAGGGGTRLWPLSRVKKPKQFIDLGHGKSLLQLAYGRAKSLTEVDNIYVATSRNYEDLVREQLPDVDEGNIFYEPEKRDTTAAFATVAIRLRKKGQGGVPTIFMWADHIFTNEEEFLGDLKAIPEIVESYPDHIVVVGHTAISPETALGYIEAGDRVPERDDVFAVNCFKEKPDLKTAEEFLAAGNYFWNMGYFSLKPDYFIEELLAINPDLEDAIKGYEKALDSGEDEAREAYGGFPKVSIEYTLIEKTKRRLVITGDYGWIDVGYWTTVEKILGETGDYAPKGHHVHVNSDGNFVYNATDKTVSLLGVKDSIVVVTDDAVLVSSKENCGDIKSVIAELEESGREDVL